MVLQGASSAIAQFAPFGNQNQNQTYTQNQAYGQNQVPSQGRYQTYAPQQAYAPNQVYTPKQVYPQNQVYTQNLNQIYSQNPRIPQPQTQPQMQPQYTAMAFQANGSQVATPTTEAMPPVPMQVGGNAAQPGPGCSTCQSAPMANFGGGCATGSCAGGGYGYNTFANSCGYGNQGASCGGLGSQCGQRGGGRRWFGGFYGLYMERAGNPWRALAFSTPTGNPTGYYPADNEIVMNLTNLDNDTFAGAEVRFGSTLGQGGACGCGPRYGWEVGYWGLLEEEKTAVVTDLSTDANRLYGMISHTGVFYNGRSANDYFDYGPPTANPAGNVIRIRQLTARNNFSMQNLEVNLLRFPVYGGGYYSSAAGGSLGGGRLGGCSAGGCDTCGGGSCRAGGGSASGFSATGMIGFRYVRIDDDFMFRSDFEDETAATTGYLSRSVDVDNHLVGAQFGCNMIYRFGCSGRWALHANSVVGVFGNHSEVWNRMNASGGPVTYQNGDTFNNRYQDDGISVLGELRAEASYQYSRNWRLFGGYRLVGISGVALAFDQIAAQNISAAQASYVNSNGSIFVHGLQGGVEYTY